MRVGGLEGSCSSGATVIKGPATIRLSALKRWGEVSPRWLNGIGSLRAKGAQAMQPAGQRSEGMDLGDQREDKEYAHFTV